MLIAATRGWFETLERDIIHTLTCTWDNPFLGRTFLAVQKDELGIPLFLLALLIIGYRHPARAWRALFTALLAVGIAMGVASLLWLAVDRRRPPFAYQRWLETPQDQALCADHPDWLALHKSPSRSPSFPSRHGLSVGVFVVALGLASRKVGSAALVYGALVAVGRVYAGRHWPSDVLAGLAIGGLLAWGAWNVVPRLPGLRRLVAEERAACTEGA